MIDEAEALCIQIILPHLQPILTGCCYNPPSKDMNYLDDTCEKLPLFILSLFK